MEYKWYPPVTDEDMSAKYLRQFYTFVYERQAVWHNRFIKRLPREKWTNDKILSTYKYTNVYRELDRGTIWMMDNIMAKYGDLSTIRKVKDLIWELCVYRLLNKVETFDQIGIISYNDYNRKSKRMKWFRHIDQLLAGGFPVWTNAHITLQSSFKQPREKNYYDILYKLEAKMDMIARIVRDPEDIQDVFKAIKNCYGFGPFTSYEVATDLAYHKNTLFDVEKWANPGPGCQVGLRIIFPQAKTADDFQMRMKQLRDKQKEIFSALELPFGNILYNGTWLSLRNIEHSLCEFGKYWKQKRGLGKARSRFTPVTK